MNRRDALHATGGFLLAGLAGCTSDAAQSGSGATLEDTRVVLERYKDHRKALEDGYQDTNTCIEGYGTPFANSDIEQITYDSPQILLYERTDSGAFELRGAEWFVPHDEVDDPENPPSLFAGEDRKTMDGPMTGHYPSQPRHYGLHVWLFGDNPDGIFAKSNPDIGCAERVKLFNPLCEFCPRSHGSSDEPTEQELDVRCSSIERCARYYSHFVPFRASSFHVYRQMNPAQTRLKVGWSPHRALREQERWVSVTHLPY